MLIKFENIESKIFLNDDNRIFCLEIENKKWFSRVCQSLVSKKFIDAVEPFVIWDDNNKKIKKNDYIVIVDPFNLPFNDRTCLKLLYEKINRMYTEELDIRKNIETINFQLEKHVSNLELMMLGDYCVDEWDFKKYLSFLKFKPEVDCDDDLLNNLIKYVNFRKDLGSNDLLIFINLKNFLNENDYNNLIEHIFSLDFYVFFVENIHDESMHEKERKLHIDKDLFEYYIN